MIKEFTTYWEKRVIMRRSPSDKTISPVYDRTIVDDDGPLRTSERITGIFHEIPYYQLLPFIGRKTKVTIETID